MEMWVMILLMVEKEMIHFMLGVAMDKMFFEVEKEMTL
jgi:hypothetical protein